jgi:hypothetical protein
MELAAGGVDTASETPAAADKAMGPQAQGTGRLIRQGSSEHKGSLHLLADLRRITASPLRHVALHLLHDLTQRHRPASEQIVEGPKNAALLRKSF